MSKVKTDENERPAKADQATSTEEGKPDAKRPDDTSTASKLLLEDDDFYEDQLVPPMPTMGW